MAASSVTETHRGLGNLKKVEFAVTFSSVDGSFTDYTILSKFEGFLLSIETNPGGTAPTNLYDITIEDAEGLDVLMSAGLNRATATTEIASIPLGTYHHPTVDSEQVLTMKIANQSVNSATTKVILVYSMAT